MGWGGSEWELGGEQWLENQGGACGTRKEWMRKVRVQVLGGGCQLHLTGRVHIGNRPEQRGLYMVPIFHLPGTRTDLLV